MIEFTDTQLKKAEMLLGNIEGALPKAQSNAINRALATSRAEVVRAVRKEYVVAAEAVRNTIIIKAATPQKPQGAIRSSGSPIALSKFDTKPGKPGGKVKNVVVRVKKSGGYKPIQRVFVAKFASGHIGIVKRVVSSRLPIKQLYGPSIPQMVGSKHVSRQIEEKALETLDKRLEHEIYRILEGFK